MDNVLINQMKINHNSIHSNIHCELLNEHLDKTYNNNKTEHASFQRDHNFEQQKKNYIKISEETEENMYNVFDQAIWIWCQSCHVLCVIIYETNVDRGSINAWMTLNRTWNSFHYFFNEFFIHSSYLNHQFW